MYTPGYAWGHMSLQEDAEPDGTALGDCVGCNMVFSILPGDSSWEEARPEPGSKIAIKCVGSQGSGCQAHALFPFCLHISRGSEQAPL